MHTWRHPSLLVGVFGAALLLTAGCTADPDPASDSPTTAAESEGDAGDPDTPSNPGEDDTGSGDVQEGEETALDEFAVDARSMPSTNAGRLTSVEVAEGDGVDTVTFDFGAGNELPGFEVTYVDRLVLGEDEVIDAEGDATMTITFTESEPGADGMTGDDVPTNEAYGAKSVRQLILLENLGGTLTFGLGLTDEVEFRVTTDADAGALVLELKHP